jgi:amino acid transporter
VLEYTISAAAVARGWTSYAATLLGLPSDALRLNAGAVQLDPLAAANVALQAGILCLGMRESSNFNIAVNVVNLCCIAFVLLAGAGQVDRANYSPFMPYGISGGAREGVCDAALRSGRPRMRSRTECGLSAMCPPCFPRALLGACHVSVRGRLHRLLLLHRL